MGRRGVLKPLNLGKLKDQDSAKGYLARLLREISAVYLEEGLTNEVKRNSSRIADSLFQRWGTPQAVITYLKELSCGNYDPIRFAREVSD